jgi:hypothetical protein
MLPRRAGAGGMTILFWLMLSASPLAIMRQVAQTKLSSPTGAQRSGGTCCFSLLPLSKFTETGREIRSQPATVVVPNRYDDAAGRQPESFQPACEKLR